MRGLTAGEAALLRDAFGDRLDCRRVRLRRGAGGNPVAAIAFANGNSAIALRRSVYFRTHYSENFTQAGVAAQALLHHEMVHVWQFAELGVARFLARYAREFADCRFSPAAMYRYWEGETPFASARLEAQAQMVGDYCEARLCGDVPRQARIAANLRGSGFYGL